MSEVSKVCNAYNIVLFIKGIRGVKHCTVLPIKSQRLCISEVWKVVFVAFTQQYIQSNLTHVRGVETWIGSSQYRVMLLMSKVSKVAQ